MLKFEEKKSVAKRLIPLRKSPLPVKQEADGTTGSVWGGEKWFVIFGIQTTDHQASSLVATSIILFQLETVLEYLHCCLHLFHDKKNV